MSRSTKKGPFVHPSLMKKVVAMNQQKEKKVIKTWSRDSSVFPEMVGHTLAIHDGKKHVPIFITENIVGHLLGESAPMAITRRNPPPSNNHGSASQGQVGQDIASESAAGRADAAQPAGIGGAGRLLVHAQGG